MATLHREVKVTKPQGELMGLAEGMDADVALLLRTPSGELQRMLAGDATLRA